MSKGRKLTSVATVDGRLDHMPADAVRVAVVADGRGTHATVYGTRTLCKGDVLLLRPGGWQAFVECHGLRLATAEVPPPAAGGARPEVARLLFAARACDGAAAYWVGEAALAECLLRWNDLPALLDCLADALGSELDATKVRVPHRAVAAAIALMEADVAVGWTVPALAARVGVDPAYLSRLFRRDTSRPPMAYLNRRRAEAAAARLLITRGSVADVADAVGWPAGNTFARCFRRHFSTPATSYRKSALGGLAAA